MLHERTLPLSYHLPCGATCRVRRWISASALCIGLSACEGAPPAPQERDEDIHGEEHEEVREAPKDAATAKDASANSSRRDASSATEASSERSRDAAIEAATSGHAHEPESAAKDAGNAPPAERDHCVAGELADPNSRGLMDAPDQWKGRNNAIDLVLPKSVLAWMGDRVWEASHDAWHNIRRCRGGLNPFGGAAAMTICSHTELIPAHQECADAEDGYQFLVMHRHMMQALRQAFPTTPDLFQGFPSFPYEAKDVPEAWRGRFGSGWSQAIKDVAKTLEDIENKLAQFPTEGDLGRYIQCGGMGGSGANSVHGALHFKWVVNDSPYSLGKQTVNIDNYMFWKLHGWIDQIWERYRKAKNLSPDEPKLKEALISQCREMHTLGSIVGGAKPPVGGSTPLPEESGTFHETVRPILERVCSGCHSESSPEGSLPLGGDISSADIVKALVGVKAARGGQFMRVVPGEPEQSWLYLKVSGGAASAGCRGTCNAQVMPPSGQVSLSQDDLTAISSWIRDGAPAP